MDILQVKNQQSSLATWLTEVKHIGGSSEQKNKPRHNKCVISQYQTQRDTTEDRDIMGCFTLMKQRGFWVR